MEWYIKKGVALDLGHFLLRARDTGDWKGDTINRTQLLELLRARINSVNFEPIREDVKRFIPDDFSLKIWDAKYFTDLIEKLKFEE